MKALVRADASVEIGMGHRVRCQALIHAFNTLGWQCQFVVHRRYAQFSSPEDLIIESEAEFWSLAERADLVVLDHYQYQADQINQLFQHQPNLLVLDDMNDRGIFSAKWVLNPLNETYSDQVSSALTGSEFALLRPVFSQFTNIETVPKKLLITLGGTDPLALTLPILRALLASGFDAKSVQVLLGANAMNSKEVLAFCQAENIDIEQGLSDVTPLMGQAKMAISAAGGTLFELACIGVPTVFVQVADNQTRSLEQHVPKGWCHTVRFDNVDMKEQTARIEQLIEKVNSLWLNIEWQKHARYKAQTLVDGKGAQRVADIINQYFTDTTHLKD